MAQVPERNRDGLGVFGGVDTHKDVHVAAAVDAAGRLLGTASFPSHSAGYEQLWSWLSAWGTVERVGVEGTGSYGAGLARCLTRLGAVVVEVNRPNRQLRRRRGKSDTVDAEAAARAALGGDATAQPKSGTGAVEAIRMLSVARRSALKARTQAANQISGLIVTAPEHLKDRLRTLTGAKAADACARLRPHTAPDPLTAAAKTALRSLARRYHTLTAEIDALDAELLSLCEQANPALLSAPGVGPDVAAALLTAAGDNPHRMHSEASFAALCGASPVQASSGTTVRHRLNRGGNRHANNALWRITISRMRTDQRTIDYTRRRQAQGKTRREITRCLKRYIAREIYRLLTDPPPTPNGADLRRQRTHNGLTLTDAARATNTTPTRISALERSKHHNSDLAERYQHYLTQATT